MKRTLFNTRLLTTIFAFAMTIGLAIQAHATPSTEYWTPCIMDIQPAGVAHLTYDTYSSHRGDLSTDLGLEYGMRLSKVVNAEVGFDWFSRVQYPIYLNAKVGVAEGGLAKNSPGINVGIFNVGTKKSDAASGIAGTNQNVFDVIVGKTVAPNFRVHAGAYSGNKNVLISSTGKKQSSGFMFAFDYGFSPTKAGYNKFVLVGDYASGKNAIGGGGVGLTYNLSPKAGIIAGPVWFNDQGINGKVKWTVQLDVNL